MLNPDSGFVDPETGYFDPDSGYADSAADVGPDSPPSRKRRRRQVSAGITLSGGRIFPGLKEYVIHLLSFRSERYPDPDFAERTLMNLGRKITKYGDSELSEWERCVRLRDPNTGCVRVARPRDSRMAVSRTPGGGVKKVYPAIIVAQIFRFPQVVFHNDIRSVRECAHQAPVKKERPDHEDLICVNPYHYEMTLEAYARLKKKQNIPSSASLKKTQEEEEEEVKEPLPSMASECDRFRVPSVSPPPGVDHQAQWEKMMAEKDPEPPVFHEFVESELMDDLQAYDVLPDGKGGSACKKIEDLEDLHLFGVADSIHTIVREKYVKIPVLKNNEEEGVKSETAVATPLDKDFSSMDIRGGEESVKIENNSVDEIAIQDLLDDIRGSFERQFDDDLNVLATSTDVVNGTFFPQEENPSWNSQQHPPPPPPPPPQQQLHSHNTGTADGLMVSGGDWNSSNYLEGPPVSRDEFDNYFPQSSQQQHVISHMHQQPQHHHPMSNPYQQPPSMHHNSPQSVVMNHHYPQHSASTSHYHHQHHPYDGFGSMQ